MNRRIYRVILVFTALTLVGFGVPLAIVARKLSHDELIERLESEATRAALVVPESTELHNPDVDVEFPEAKYTRVLGIYGPDGKRVLGEGPLEADRMVTIAAKGYPARGSADGSLVVAIPVISNHRVYAVVRASTPMTRLNQDVRSSWLLMGILAAATMVAAAAAARFEARRLSKPVEDLALAMGRLGGGDFSVRTTRSGVPELDEAAAALEATAGRLGDLVARERAFSSNASHQLRTPLTGIRLQLENAIRNDPSGAHTEITEALTAVDRLETTIGDLLELTRQQTLTRDTVDLVELLTRQQPSWQVIATSLQRTLDIQIESGLPPIGVSEAAVRQIIEVLVSNAFNHGEGTVRVSAARRVGGVAIEVSDEGEGVSEAVAELFHNRVIADAEPPPSSRIDTAGHGIGLPLARSLAESAGGRLVLRNTGPHPQFTLLLLVNDD